jgi:hypothetical protein
MQHGWEPRTEWPINTFHSGHEWVVLPLLTKNTQKAPEEHLKRLEYKLTNTLFHCQTLGISPPAQRAATLRSTQAVHSSSGISLAATRSTIAICSSAETGSR